jgi:hypothetical protein
MFGAPNRFIHLALSSPRRIGGTQSASGASSRSHFARTWILPVEAFAVSGIAKPVDLASSSVVDSTRPIAALRWWDKLADVKFECCFKSGLSRDLPPLILSLPRDMILATP